MEIILSSFIFILGVCIGSFLNCVVYRIEQEKSFLVGRSFCPNCKHNLNWLDLVPIFSYLFLGGKCRYCKNKISIQYPIIEILTGILFVLIFLNSGFSFASSGVWVLGFGFWDFINLVFLFYVASVLVIIFLYDLKHYLIPDNVLFPAIIISILYKIFEFLNFYSFNILKLILHFKFQISNFAINYLLAVAIAFGFFFILWFASRGKWMGFGDVKLAILLGLVLGFPNILVALFLAFFFGAIIGVVLMGFNKKNMKSEIPFGPFLISGTFVAMLWGTEIINWYTSLFMF
jgi:leader peptidase (prepilin peptidase)/N-methyltransferase